MMDIKKEEKEMEKEDKEIENENIGREVGRKRIWKLRMRR